MAKKQGGTKVGNFIRKTVSNIKTGAKVVASSPITKTIAKSASVGLPGGSMAASVYNSVAPVVQKASSTSTKAKPVSLYAPLPAGAKNMSYATDVKKNMSYANEPQFSPAGGVGSQVGNFTLTESGYIPTSKAGPKQKTGGIPTVSSGGGSNVSGGGSSSSSLSARMGGFSPSASSVSGSSYGGFGGVPGATGSPGGYINVPTGASVVGGAEFDYEKTPQQIAEEEAMQRAKEYADQQSRQKVDPENTYQDALRQFQGEIDAVNQVYAERLRQAALEGKSRLGSTRAENFNAGIVDSSFGSAATERAMSENRAVEGGIMGEKLQALSQIESAAREMGNKYYQDKKAAKEAGLENYLAAIKGAGAVKEGIATDIATSIFNSGIAVDEIKPERLAKIAKEAGITVQSIKNQYELVRRQLTPQPEDQPASIQEYEYAVSQGYTGSYNDFKTEDANRKIVESAGGTAPGAASNYSIERAARTVQSVDELLKKVSGKTTGYGSLLAILPATEAREFKAQLQTLKANIAFNELTAMREASKTGGALGQVSNIEIGLLESSLGALDRAQSPAEFKAQLEKIKQSINRWTNEVAKSGGVSSSGTGGGLYDF